jgi:trans-2,3-dihydro-3-hydroxyanthranilate isomerase
MQVDAFTEQPLGGNPCAVVFDADDLDAEERLSIAREMNLSETAFISHSRSADFGVRFYTPAEEIPLAGHPTIATTFALVDSGHLTLDAAVTSITLELAVGPIHVDIHAEKGKAGLIIMTQKKPLFLNTYTPEDVLPLFGLQKSDALPGVPIQTVSTGTPQLMIPLTGHAALRRACLDIHGYSEFRSRADFFSPHLFCLGGATLIGATFARHFGTPPDLMEDPFTGSATGGMAAYLWHYGLIDQPQFTAEQGHWLNRPGQAQVEVVGPPKDIESVRVGGKAVTVMRGNLCL